MLLHILTAGGVAESAQLARLTQKEVIILPEQPSQPTGQAIISIHNEFYNLGNISSYSASKTHIFMNKLRSRELQ